jgi:hypothetical protein
MRPLKLEPSVVQPAIIALPHDRAFQLIFFEHLGVIILGVNMGCGPRRVFLGIRKRTDRFFEKR